MVQVVPALWRVHWWQVCRLFDASGLIECWRLSSGRVSLVLSLFCFVFGALSLNMALFRVFRGFLAWFGVVVWV